MGACFVQLLKQSASDYMKNFDLSSHVSYHMLYLPFCANSFCLQLAGSHQQDYDAGDIHDTRLNLFSCFLHICDHCMSSFLLPYILHFDKFSCYELPVICATRSVATAILWHNSARTIQEFVQGQRCEKCDTPPWCAPQMW